MKDWQAKERMGFPAQKKYILNDRRFARHFAEVERLTRRYAKALFDNVLGLFGIGADVQQKIRAKRRSLSRHYGISGAYRPHQGEREIARRKRQIERGILNEANGLVRNAAISNGKIVPLT